MKDTVALKVLMLCILCICIRMTWMESQDPMSGTHDRYIAQAGEPSQELLAVMAMLCVEAPIEEPVDLVVDDHSKTNTMGWVHWDGDRFLISISDDLEPALQAKTLVHEYAHCLVYDAYTEGDHGPLWGVAYARCYRVIYPDR